MDPLLTFKHFTDFLDLFLPNLSKEIKAVVLPTLFTAFIWISVVFLSKERKDNLVRLVLKNKWFYIFNSVVFVIFVFASISTRPVQFDVFVSDSFRSNTSPPFLQRWVETSCDINNTIIIKSSKGKILSLFHDKGKYGLGFQYRDLKPINLSEYQNGHLHLLLRIDSENIEKLRIGIQSQSKHDAWLDITKELKSHKGEWLEIELPIQEFKVFNQKLNLSKIIQFAMFNLVASQNGRLDIKDLYWTSN